MRKVGQEGRNAFILEGSDIYQPRIVCLPHYFIIYKNYLPKLNFYWLTRILGNKFILSINYVRKNGKMKIVTMIFKNINNKTSDRKDQTEN